MPLATAPLRPGPAVAGAGRAQAATADLTGEKARRRLAAASPITMPDVAAGALHGALAKFRAPVTWIL